MSFERSVVVSATAFIMCLQSGACGGLIHSGADCQLLTLELGHGQAMVAISCAGKPGSGGRADCVLSRRFILLFVYSRRRTAGGGLQEEDPVCRVFVPFKHMYRWQEKVARCTEVHAPMLLRPVAEML